MGILQHSVALSGSGQKDNLVVYLLAIYTCIHAVCSWSPNMSILLSK